MVYVLLVIVAQLAVAWVVYQKLSKAVQDSRHEFTRQSNNVFSQVEALMAVTAEVRPTRALPKSRDWAASPDFLAVLISLAHEHRPQTVVECSSGFSTVVLAASLRNLGRGHVFSLEHDEIYATKTRRMLELHGLADWATVVVAPLTPQKVADWSGRWYDAARLPPEIRIDLLVIDGPPKDTNPMARFPALPVLFERFASQALVVLDDADRSDETRAVEQWQRAYPKLQAVRVAECEKGCVALRVDNFQ